MVDHPDYGSRNASAGKDRLSVGGSDAAVFLGGAAIGALFGGALGYFLLRFASGDEPPIRVKGGSMEFQLLTSSKKWEKEGDKKHWKLSGGTRGKEEYQLSIIVQVGGETKCIEASGKKVQVTHGGGVEVELKGNGHHTKLSSSYPLEPSSDDQVLNYTGVGSIESVAVDGTTVYSPKLGDFKHMLMLDY